MSVEVTHYKCPGCGHEEVQQEGIYLFSDLCYVPLRCPSCYAADSIPLTEEVYNARDYPYCVRCHVQLTEWSSICPRCGRWMDITQSYSDVI